MSEGTWDGTLKYATIATLCILSSSVLKCVTYDGGTESLSELTKKGKKVKLSLCFN